MPRQHLHALEPPIVWLASGDAADVHDEGIVAVEFERWLCDRNGTQ